MPFNRKQPYDHGDGWRALKDVGTKVVWIESRYFVFSALSCWHWILLLFRIIMNALQRSSYKKRMLLRPSPIGLISFRSSSLLKCSLLNSFWGRSQTWVSSSNIFRNNKVFSRFEKNKYGRSNLKSVEHVWVNDIKQSQQVHFAHMFTHCTFCAFVSRLSSLSPPILLPNVTSSCLLAAIVNSSYAMKIMWLKS